MAYTTKVKGTKVTIALGDGATPTEVFTVLCGFSEKGLTRTKAVTDTVDWDCADSTLPPITIRDIQNSDWQISASGLFHATQRTLVDTFFDLTVSRNVRFVFDDTAVDGYYMGKGIMTSLEWGATNGSYITASITIQGDGVLAWTATP